MISFWIAFGLLAACYGLFRFAMTLHSVPGSITLFVSAGFGLASVFALGFAVGQFLL